MARTLVKINKQIEKLQLEADRVRAKEVAGVVSRIKTAIAFYGLSAADLFGVEGKAGRAALGARKLKTKKAASAPKYQDKQTGKTWTGHGKRPSWFRQAVESGTKPEDMAI